MEAQILDELIIIKWLLVALVLVCAVPALATILTRVLGFRIKLQGRSDQFVQMCTNLFEDAEYTELTELCETEIRKRPNNASAHFWLARAYLSTKNYSKARINFEKAAVIEPSWQKNTIQPYLDSLPNES